MESSRGLKVIDLQMPDYMRVLETCVQYGFPVLLQNVQERLDPSLDSVLNKAIIKIGKLTSISDVIAACGLDLVSGAVVEQQYCKSRKFHEHDF